MKKLISIIGDAVVDDSNKRAFAYAMGKALVDNGYRVVSGGLGGIMKAVFEGARASEFYQEGDTIAILPYFDRTRSNGYADIVIATGLDLYRNIIVANSDAVIAVGGGAGTLCELSSAWTLKRLILAYEDCDGWSAKIAGERLDNRIRYENIEEDRVFGVKTPDEAIAILEKYIGQYDRWYQGIKP
ncbi:MAG: LOG family protein [Bacteroides sp.]|nr:LOG family protein [Bacillota bacterium]MCM1394407.1 LOG family protein [[Eubacterium] siraeum]MCM1455188.1 LOG family protein [Bacteroides sp.]